MSDFKIRAGTAAGAALILPLFIRDSSVTTGAGKTGLAYNTTGLTAYYLRNTDAAPPTAIALASCTVGTYLASGFVEVDATHMPGAYELHLPAAVVAAGADRCQIILQGAAGMQPCVITIEIGVQDTVALDMTQAVPASNTAGTVGDTLNAARAGAFGKYVVTGTPGQPGSTLDIYASDNTTVVKTFSLAVLGARS